MRDLNELNINEGGDPVDRAAPTEREIASFEAHFGVRLPDDYLQLLRHSNGGHPELDCYIPKGASEKYLREVGEFYQLGDDKDDLGGLWRATSEWRSATGKNIVPIGASQGGDQIVLSYDLSPASVWLCLHDEEFAMVFVADSFGEFIDMLCMNPDYI